MEALLLDYRIHTNTETGCLCRYVRSDVEDFCLHYHNYYEIFLVLKGDVYHVINGKEQILHEGQLLFIRDFDIHEYKPTNENVFEFINLAISKESLFSLFEYLGTVFPSEQLFKFSMPPIVNLSMHEKEKLFFQLTELNQNLDKDIVKLKLKILLLKVFAEYFFNYNEKKIDIPLWLEMTYEKMHNPKNFIIGLDRMYEISGRSHEHLCRSLKTYYNTTPSALVSDLRLEHSVNLLLTSNLSVTDICYESGFDNLSWFYKLFSKKYGITPTKFRKKYE